MKQKYTIQKNDEKNQLIIKEYAELDKEIMSFLCETTYDAAAIQSVIGLGKEALVAQLRTENMYPPNVYAERIAETVMKMYQGSDADPQAEVLFDDMELMGREYQHQIVDEEIEEETGDIDDILEDDFNDEYEEEEDLKLDSPLKIADDENGEFDDEA
jgi:hypothetical protein